MRYSALITYLCLAQVAYAQAPQQQMLMGKQAAAGGSSSITVIQTVGSCSHVTGANTTTISISPTNGNWLIVSIAADTVSTTITSVQDNLSNNFIQDVDKNPGSIGHHLYFYSLKVGSGVTSVVVTFSQPEYNCVDVCEVNGLVASSPVDVADATGGQPSGATWTTGNLVTTNADDIVFGWAYWGDGAVTLTASSPWTVALSVTDGANGLASALVYRIVTSTGTYAPTGTVGAFSVGITYKGT